MPTYIRSGSKITVVAPTSTLQKIAAVLKVPIKPSNQGIGSHVTIPAKKLPTAKEITEQK